ncbi:MAG: hypothetical protein IBJ03_15820 [Gemmatimonadaceae bacterium]|nr:hypothetical protein [Gemmatimonadaceae bacterium]
MKRIALALLFGLATTARAQQAPQVVKLVDGREIHVSGLRRWTVAMIQDSLGKYSPADSLQSHACAAALRYKLHFADASAITLMMAPHRPDIIFVDVREPQDSSRVRYRDVPLDTTSPKPEWQSVTTIMARRPGQFRKGVMAHFGEHVLSPTDTLAKEVVTFLAAQRSPANRSAALSVLRTSANYRDRGVAAVVLGNYPSDPEVWKALFDAMLETDGVVRGFAMETVERVTKNPVVTPDWRAAATTVHSVLDGTSLFLLPDMIQLLARRSDVEPQLAASFLAGGGEMLLNYLASAQPVRSRPAHALLVKLRGEDLGTDPAVWRRWIADLQ